LCVKQGGNRKEMLLPASLGKHLYE
jgi:hypothetical protein